MVDPDDWEAAARHRLRAKREADELARLRALVPHARALVAALPRCERCDAPATRAWGPASSTPRWCEAHGSHVPECHRAAPLRALLDALEDYEAIATAGGAGQDRAPRPDADGPAPEGNPRGDTARAAATTGGQDG